ncbi:MAG: hypothetical protein ABSC94_06600 [Polyangiaceae bacterium]
MLAIGQTPTIAPGSSTSISPVSIAIDSSYVYYAAQFVVPIGVYNIERY